MVKLTNPYTANTLEYIYTVEGLFNAEDGQYRQTKKVIISFYNGRYIGYELDGFKESDIPEAEDVLELQTRIAEKVKQLKEEQ